VVDVRDDAEVADALLRDHRPESTGLSVARRRSPRTNPAGLEIGQRTNHSYYIDRYPVGLDATVFKTDSYETDMTFRNDTANPIVIRSYWGSGFVRFDIWGVPDGRTVTLSKPITSNHGTAVWTTVTNPALKPGTSVIREYPHDGFDAVVTRWVRDADGNLIHTDIWTSHYRTVNGITEYGPRRS
jgi:hypothetical protein